MDLDEETMEAMFGQDLASDTDILGMWIPEVLDWPTWVCDFTLWPEGCYHHPTLYLHCFTRHAQ